MKFIGTIMHCDSPNRNGRIYSSEMMEKQIEEFNKRCEKDGFVLGMPGGDGYKSNTILSDVSHRIDKLYFDDNKICAEGQLLNTPMGKILDNVGIDNLGFEIIGTGNVDENNVVQNFNLQRIDILTKDKCAWDDAEIKEV